jgi:nucleoside-diphosphate-sugar epimerase
MSKEFLLVTGAEGFIGRHLVAALRGAGRPVHTHDRGDGNIASCPLRFEDVRHVFHLAARTFVPDSWKNPRDFYEVNTLGTANVLEFCRRSGASLTLLSSYVYGNPLRLPIAEDHPLRPFNPYAHSKILAEQITAYYQDQFGVRAAVIRPFNIYGPGQATSFLIPTMISQALDPACEAITVADLRPRRDFLYVRDLVSLLIATVDLPASAVLNAGSGASTSIGELLQLINDLLPSPKPLVSTCEERPAEVIDVVADISRAKKELNWAPRVVLAEGLRETMDRMRELPRAGRPVPQA